MARFVRMLAPLAALVAASVAHGQDPALEHPHRRPAPDPDPFDRGLDRLEQGFHWEARRYFRELVTLDPQMPLGHLGLALASREAPRLAAKHAYFSFYRRERATPPLRTAIEAYARYFGAEARPDDADPRHDVAPSTPAHRALIAALERMPAEPKHRRERALVRRLTALERDRKRGPAPLTGEAAVRAANAGFDFSIREGAMPFVVPGLSQTLRDAYQHLGADADGENALALLPRHPRFPADRGAVANLAGDRDVQMRSKDSLVSERWLGPRATPFDLPRGLGGRRAFKPGRALPTLVVFFLGFGCVHCVAQLGELDPKAYAFRAAGINVITIGTDDANNVKAAHQAALENGIDPLHFDVLCDPAGDVFRQWGAWDQFDDEALHATFLVDGNGHILWQDISTLPFLDTDFLLEECTRLLAAHRAE
ncbi:MAG: redoxin domain-containing protein [Planctomycetota bacterium]